MATTNTQAHRLLEQAFLAVARPIEYVKAGDRLPYTGHIGLSTLGKWERYDKIVRRMDTRRGTYEWAITAKGVRILEGEE